MSESPALPSFTRSATRRARRSVLVLPLVAVLALAGCSSGSSSSGTAGGSTAGTTSAATLAAASKLLEQAGAGAVTGPSYGPVTADQIVPWSADMMPTPAPLPQGKKIRVDIVYGLAVGEGPYLAKLTAAVATKLGWEAKIIQATDQSQASTLAALQQAVNDKPSAIVSFVIPGVWVGGALAKAKAAGIATVDIHQDSSTGPGYDAWVPNAEGIAKSLMAAYAIKTSKGKATSLLFDAPGFSDANMPAAKKYLDTCGGCTSKAGQINPADFIDPVKLQGNISATLAGNPGTDYLMWPNASLPLQPVVAAIRSSTSKDAKVLTNGMGPVPLALVKAGALPLLVQSPDALLVLAALDNVSRLAQGQPPIAEDALRLPISYWTKDNAPDAKDFAAITKAQLANDFLTPYEKAWGVSLRDTVLGVSNLSLLLAVPGTSTPVDVPGTGSSG